MNRCFHSLLAITCALLPHVVSAAGLQEAEQSKPHLVIVMAEGEYKTDRTLPPFAKSNLQPDFRVTLLFASEDNPNAVPGLEAIKTADVVLLSVRRRPLPPNQLATIRAYIEQGKPLVAMRTSSHAFCLRNQPPPAGLAEWPDFDQQILGCHYHNHHGNSVKTYVYAIDKLTEHPILRGVSSGEFRVFGSLYQSLPVADSATILMMGRAEDITPHEPVAWTNIPQTGGRVFYMSLGHPQDFSLPDFVRLLRNGIYWAAGLPTPTRDVEIQEDAPQK